MSTLITLMIQNTSIILSFLDKLNPTSNNLIVARQNEIPLNITIGETQKPKREMQPREIIVVSNQNNDFHPGS